MARVIPKTPHRGYVSLASGQFAALYRRGTRSKSNGLLVISAPADPGPPQVGIVAGRGVGNAVRRNRAKRRLREAMSRAGLRSDTAYVVVASPEVVTMPFDRLMARLAEAITGIEETER